MTNRPRLLALFFILAAMVLITFAFHTISPWRQPGPIAQLLVGQEYATAAAFDSRALDCPEQQDNGERGDGLRIQARCTVSIGNQPLTITVAHQGLTGTCTANYMGEALPCETRLALYNAPLPSVMVRSDLGLDPALLRSLPGTNPLFYVSEHIWFWVQCALAAVIALGAALIAMRGTIWSRETLLGAALRLAGYGVGLVTTFALVWYALIFVLLSSGLID
jgi:hypothetical protein